MEKKIESKIQIYIRPELFDHLIYPLGVKLDDNTIIQLFRTLHFKSEIDFKINIKEWIQRAKEIGITETEANILFKTYKIFDSDNPEYTNNINSRYESSNNKNSVDVRFFGLFFVLQTYAQRMKTSLNIDKGDKSPTYFSSPLSSPRGKSSNSFRNQNAGLEYQVYVNFIKNNINLLLRIIASDIHNTETTLNVNEFNILKFIFMTEDEGNKNNNNLNNNNIKKNTLSTYTHFFDNLPIVTKIKMNIVKEFLLNVISNEPSEKSNYIKLKHLSKCVTIKNQNDFVNKNILITQCEDSFIYINTYMINCKISHCTNCTIVIAVINKIITIDKCEKCNITFISNFTRISNMIDSNIYLYSVCEPILFGDNRGLSLGPHNVNYFELYTQVKNSKILITHQGIKNYACGINLNSKKDIKIIPPEEFSIIVVPFENKEQFNYKLTPKIYVEALEKKYKNYLKIKSLIRDAGFQEEQEKAFHFALQGYFREWLVTSSNFKSMNNIVKMIDNPEN